MSRWAAVSLLVVSLGCNRAVLQGGDSGVDRAGDLVSITDAPVEVPARCQGSVNVSGITPEGPFLATSIRSEITVWSPSCRFPGIRIHVRGAGDSGFDIHLEAMKGDGGATFAMGDQNVDALFFGTRQASPRLFVTTTATLRLLSSDVLPVPTCETYNQSIVPTSPSLSGELTAALMMSQDGFSMSGTLTVPYCTCSPCPDTV
jgi:hypothetical protein